MVTGSNPATAFAAPAYSSIASSYAAPQTSARCRVGHAIRQRSCGSHSAGMRMGSGTVVAIGMDVVDRGQRLVRRAAAAAARCLPPPARRSRIAMTPPTSCPASWTASIAWIVEPPVVTTSSTISSARPARAAAPRCGAGARAACSPCGRRTPSRPRRRASAAQAIGSAPMVRPPTAVASQLAGLAGDQLGERARTRRGAASRAWRRRSRRRWAAGQRHLADDQGVLAQLGDQCLSEPMGCDGIGKMDHGEI